MTLMDILIIAGVFAFFGWIIYSKISKNNPRAIIRLKALFSKKPRDKLKEAKDKIEQVYEERRGLL